MKTFLSFITLSITGIWHLGGAVIFRTVERNLPAGAPSRPVLLDVDENGTNDLEFRSVSGTHSNGLVVVIPETTGIVWLKSTEAAIGNFNLDRGFQVNGLETRPLYQYTEYWDSSNPEFSRFELAFLNGFADEGEGSFFEKTGYLGFRFEGDEGTHYGYVQLNGKRVWDFEILSYAYESEPNTAIITGAIPEPSTSFILMVLPALTWRRVRSDRAR